MTNIASFASTHSQASQYTKSFKTLMAKGKVLDQTPEDQRQSVVGSSKFQQDSVTVYANQEKQQLVLAEKLEGDKVDWSYVDEGVTSDISEQTYRSVLQPNEYGVLEVLERVDSRNDQGEVVSSWQRMVETDPKSGGFSIHIPER